MADGDLLLLPEADGLPYGLGRHVHHDPRNREFPIRALLKASPRRRPWWRRGVYNQGQESSCTAQAAAGVLSTSPFRMRSPHRAALKSYDEPQERYQLYREAQKHDPWPGENYEGSSTDAPFRVLRDRGQIREWRWAFGVTDVLDTLDRWGPVAVGTVWTDRMFNPDRRGRVDIGGQVVGGHAYELLHNDASEKRVRAVNSWGTSWGPHNGRFWLTYDQLDQLLAQQGEAVTIVL